MGTITFTGIVSPYINVVYTNDPLVPYAGVLGSTFDGAGLFGPIGTSITGDPFTAVYRFSTLGNDTVTSATITINEHSFVYGAGVYSYVRDFPSGLISASVAETPTLQMEMTYVPYLPNGVYYPVNVQGYFIAPTGAFLQVNTATVAVPIPDLGTGWTSLFIIALLGVWFYQRLRPRPCPVFH